MQIKVMGWRTNTVLVTVCILCSWNIRLVNGDSSTEKGLTQATTNIQEILPKNVSLDTDSNAVIGNKSATPKVNISEGPKETTTEVPQHLKLVVGNNTIQNVCNISLDDYTKLTDFYPQYCSKGPITNTEATDTEG
ncbi:unnamed protein product, partial [Meganyctiphanes norvegica]